MNTSAKDKNLSEFARVAAEELGAIKWFERIITRISEKIGCPAFLVTRLIASFMRSSHEISLNDILQIFDLLGLK